MQYVVESGQFDSSWISLIEVLTKAGASLLLYGIYINLFLLSIHIFSRRRDTKILIAASCAMAVVGTTQIAVNVAETAITARFVQQLVHGQLLNEPQSLKTLEFTQFVLLMINSTVTDTFFMYRCYVIWGYRRKVLILPALLGLTTLIVVILGAKSTSTTPARISVGFAAMTNGVLTALTAGRIMWIWHQSSHVGLHIPYRSRYGRAIGLILESGAIYCAAAIFLLITVSTTEIFDIHYIQPPPGQSFGQLIQSMARSGQLCGGLPSRPERPFVGGYTDFSAQLCLALSSSSGAMSGCVQAVFRHL
ncbi:hypothetical protein K438DRAFT_1937353 [Mycena galopus ATCC 62051]|nr:hypothetical protein K438DRAFT_1937353 [Mycena galopus ATCC 62051]